MATPSGSKPAQAPLPSTFQGVPRVRLWDDYGPVGEGASAAHYIRAENGSEYIAKGPALNPDLPYVAANEFICANAASALGLPLLDFRLIEHGTSLYFGSAWLDKNKAFYPGIDAALFARAANQERAYDIVAFDYWVYNTDRNAHNLLLRKRPAAGGGVDPELLTLNDHSHAIIQPGRTPSDLTADISESPPIHLDFLREAISSPKDLSGAVGLIEGVSNATIRTIVDSTPDVFLDSSGRAAVAQFLEARRDGLRSLINTTVGVFPNLGTTI